VEVFLSLPCVLADSGVTKIIQQKLSEEEIGLLCKSAGLMCEVQKELQF